jgi:predicted transposase YbfD/YdcC
VSDAAGSYLAAAVPAAQPAEQQQERGPAVRPHLQCDGKEVRGARRADGTSMFILSAATGGIVVADREIPAKTNEIPEIGPMLLSLDKRLPLAGWILTADALHTQREFAELAVTQLRAHYVLTVKKNQRNLHSALRGLCWAGARRHVTEDRGHGRAERRSHLLMDAPEEIKALFPHVRQVAKVTRTRTVRRWKGDGKNWRLVTETTTETVYLVTSLSALQATPQHVAAYIRAHWSIENQVHWVRDATLREDASKVSAANRARNLVTLRNLVNGLIRQSGRNGIAATIRDTEYEEGLLTALARFDTAL